MKKSKSALCLVTLLATCAALVSCNKPTQAQDGTIFTYTTAQGNTVSYTASELLKSYQQAGNSASTEFDKVYEVLIRKLYKTPEMATSLASCEREAEAKVASQIQTATKNAESNKTTVREELEKIFNNLNVGNLQELRDYYLYQEEKEQYETKFNNDYLDAIRDGSVNGLTDDQNYLMAASEKYGIENRGWIKEQVPMNIRHILVKVSAASGDYTQGEISEDKSSAGEATKLATMIMRLAGADRTTGMVASPKREPFYEIALDSEDTSSAPNYGELENPTTKVMESDLVPEFKLGTYAFETLYSQAYLDKSGEKAKTANNVELSDAEKTYYQNNVATLTPGLTEGATTVDGNIDDTQVLDDTGTRVYDFFKDGETYDDGTKGGVGQIPYGAAVALLKAAKDTTDKNGSDVWGGKATFYPRNILFNKYFNKHNVCVITPNDIAYNDSTIDPDSNNGKYKAEYGALPGFQFNTTNVLPQFEHNVLTNDEGSIILAVRAGASAYQGIHFMVVQRSGFDLEGTFYTPSDTTDEATTSTLSEYYTMVKPGETGYPMSADGERKLTFINYNNESDSQSAAWNTRQGRITKAVKNYNGAISTYIFQRLIEQGSIKFVDEAMEKRIQNYSKTKRISTKDDNYQTWVTNWKTYAELIEEQNRQRNMKFNFSADGGSYEGNATDKHHMLSEVCAIGYKDHNTRDWEKGGRCYYVQ